MDVSALKENFTNQLKGVEDQIKQLEADLEKAKEYKVKLLGGLETLELLIKEQETSEEVSEKESE
jgi:hypothetical protein